MAVALLAFTACDDILDKKPQSKLSPETYFTNMTELQLFTNSFYNNLLPKSPYNVQSDQYIKANPSDLVKGGTNRIVPNTSSNWSWTDLRKMNTCLEYMEANCKDPEAYKIYSGLCRFFRAYFYFDKVRMDGEPVEVMAKNMVKKQLTAAGILFPYGEGNKPNQHTINTALDTDMLSVIFYEALFEFESAYIEANCKDNPKAARFIDSVYDWIERKQAWMICTFPSYSDEELRPFLPDIDIEDEKVDKSARKKAKEFLASIGITSLESTDDINRIFWDMAVQRKSLNSQIRESVRIVLTSDRLMKVFNHNLSLYNTYIQEKTKDPEFMDYEKLFRQLTNEHKRTLYEIEQLRNGERKEQNKLKQERLQEESMYRKLSKKFMNVLKSNGSRFNSAYDLTSETDITEFLSWYKTVKRPVNKQTIKSICREISKREGSDELFMKMVEEHNAQYVAVEEDDED